MNKNQKQQVDYITRVVGIALIMLGFLFAFFPLTIPKEIIMMYPFSVLVTALQDYVFIGAMLVLIGFFIIYLRKILEVNFGIR